MASNPRIEDLRKRIEKEPGSRLFAQLAEELRKDGELDEAIRICREGLSRHAAYPSARMTLGRALQDKGELREARQELEAVLKGAPDNILAGRLLAECLEGLGEADAARGRYQATLALAPGDRAILAGLERLKGHAGSAGAAVAPVPAGGAGPGVASPMAPPAGPPSRGMPGAPPVELAERRVAETAAAGSGPAAEPPPIPLAAIDEPMELEQAHERGQSLYPAVHPEPVEGDPGEPPPIPISAVEEESFELETAYEAPVRGDVAAETLPPAAASGVGGEGEAAGEFDFDLESSSTAPVPVARLEPAAEEETPWLERGLAMAAEDTPPAGATQFAAPETVPDPGDAGRHAPEPREVTSSAGAAVVPGLKVPAANGAASAVAPAGERPSEIASTTLAELYFAQGLREKAAEVYRVIIRREPDNARARQRLGEIEALGVGGDATLVPTSFAPGAGGREAALQRTIARLEAFLEVVRRPRP